MTAILHTRQGEKLTKEIGKRAEFPSIIVLDSMVESRGFQRIGVKGDTAEYAECETVTVMQ